MLAYLFWHQPKAGIDASDYEDALRSFHTAQDLPSAAFRLERFPFCDESGYEDWYLVNSWLELGKLNEKAIDAVRRPPHDRAAAVVADGWGGVYELLRGEAEVPAGTVWFDKPRGERLEDFLAAHSEKTIWRRQMVLGPAPEFCCAVAPSGIRTRI